MKFFTVQWAKGEFPPKKEAEVFTNFLQNLEENKSKLPEKVFLFARNINLHDGLFKQIRYVDESNLQMTVICGDLQRGYSEISLKYFSASIDSDIFKKISLACRKDILKDKIEILGDEMGLSGAGFIHRFLVYPYQEFAICFSGFNFTSKSINSRR
jgi:hypothetical protein